MYLYQAGQTPRTTNKWGLGYFARRAGLDLNGRVLRWGGRTRLSGLGRGGGRRRLRGLGDDDLSDLFAFTPDPSAPVDFNATLPPSTYDTPVGLPSYMVNLTPAPAPAMTPGLTTPAQQAAWNTMMAATIAPSGSDLVTPPGVPVTGAGMIPTSYAPAAATALTAAAQIAQIASGSSGAPRAAAAAPASSGIAGIPTNTLLMAAGGALLLALVAGGGKGRR